MTTAKAGRGAEQLRKDAKKRATVGLVTRAVVEIASQTREYLDERLTPIEQRCTALAERVEALEARLGAREGGR